jgi:rubrerythrin
MDFSLFDEAARDYDAERAEYRTAMVRTAVTKEIFPFLAVASSTQEYAHRKALAADRLADIAQRTQASLEETEAAADRMFTALLEGRQSAAEGLAATAGTMSCSNCGHGSTDHSEGLQCPTCGCGNFTPQTIASRKEARQVTAEGEGEGPFS